MSGRFLALLFQDLWFSALQSPRAGALFIGETIGAVSLSVTAWPSEDQLPARTTTWKRTHLNQVCDCDPSCQSSGANPQLSPCAVQWMRGNSGAAFWTSTLCDESLYVCMRATQPYTWPPERGDWTYFSPGWENARSRPYTQATCCRKKKGAMAMLQPATISDMPAVPGAASM